METNYLHILLYTCSKEMENIKKVNDCNYSQVSFIMHQMLKVLLQKR